MDIDFDTTNMVIVAYPPAAGGKFLINCLGLSDGAIFQDSRLAERQLRGEFKQVDKMNHLITRLNETKINGKWYDLGMGCVELLGICAPLYVDYDSIHSVYYSEITSKLSNGDKLFFMVAHVEYQLEACLKVWKNAKVIIFKNTEAFVKQRRLYIKPYNFQITTEIIKQNNIFSWDTDSYSTEEATINGIDNLYKELGLTDFNRELVSEYYRQWIDTLDYLKAEHTTFQGSVK